MDNGCLRPELSRFKLRLLYERWRYDQRKRGFDLFNRNVDMLLHRDSGVYRKHPRRWGCHRLGIGIMRRTIKVIADALSLGISLC